MLQAAKTPEATVQDCLHRGHAAVGIPEMLKKAGENP